MHGLHVRQHVLVALLLLGLQPCGLADSLHGGLGKALDGRVLAILVLLHILFRQKYATVS